jgi:hypothetical protein
MNLLIIYNIHAFLNDGPFKGKIFKGNIIELKETEKVKFQDGYLIIYNRDNKLSPIIGYQINDKFVWIIEMDVKTNIKYKSCNLYKVGNLKVKEFNEYSKDFTIEFVSNWTYGEEMGWLYINKKGNFKYFYLSW